MLQKLKKFRSEYTKVFQALPFLDCYVSDMPPGWDDVCMEIPTDFRKFSFETGSPRLVMQTQHTFEEIENMAKAEPEVNFIIASGDQKMLYHYDEITRLIRDHKNIFVATANVCNVCLIEEKVREGLTGKLLYGTMAPYLDPGQALGPLVLADISWQDKCAIAGNNLRSLLGEKEILPPALPRPVIPQIIIDAHTHTADGNTKRRFPFSHVAEIWDDWKERMAFFGADIILSASSNSSGNVELYPAWKKRQFCEDSQGHIFYFEIFDPRRIESSVAALEKSLPDPLCIGVKIHPPGHGTDADAPEYEKVYQMASRYGKPIMTHSWGESYYNPTQIHGTAEKFNAYLTAYPEVKFCFGHTGGRPNGFVLAAEEIRKNPNTMGDLAGDLFHNGFIDHALKDIGANRIMFGSDIYWIDPRCMLGMLLHARISDEDLLKILRLNAEKFYLNK